MKSEQEAEKIAQPVQTEESELQQFCQSGRAQIVNANAVLPQETTLSEIPESASPDLPVEEETRRCQLGRVALLCLLLLVLLVLLLVLGAAFSQTFTKQIVTVGSGLLLPTAALAPSGLAPSVIPFTLPPPTPKADPMLDNTGLTHQQVVEAARRRALIDIDPQVPDKISIEQKEYYESRYNISKYEELPFCLFVPTFNNTPEYRYQRNIKSILMQDYTNYHIVVIDDHSDDNTGALIRQYLEGQTIVGPERYRVIINEKQIRAMANIRWAAKEFCEPEEIFMIVDGDDELLGRQVLKVFNAVYQEKKLWFVYSNFLYKNFYVGFSRPFPVSVMEKNTYRTHPFSTSHLRTFYTKLLLNIKEEDLKDANGEYLKAANDVAICIPILEMAHERVGYLPELTYHYSINTGINNHLIRRPEQFANYMMIQKKPSYQRLKNLLD